MIDLHVHSNISDGTIPPRELIRYAVAHGVHFMALTDHDTVEGVPDAMDEAAALRAEGCDITVLPGIEISAAYKKRDIHILGYCLDINSEELHRELDIAISGRENRNVEMCRRFEALGIPMKLEELYEISGSSVITRAHFADYLMKKGYVSSRSEAFDRYLNHDAPCFVPRVYMEPEVAIRIILGAGGIPVLAHPLKYDLSVKELDELIARLCSAGLRGLETYYSSNISNDEDTVRHLALSHSLIMTGGSDFHGDNKPGLEIGIGYGNLKIPNSVIANFT